jgi:hypothetical protein
MTSLLRCPPSSQSPRASLGRGRLGIRWGEYDCFILTPLHLVSSEDEPPADFIRPAVNLRTQPHRPGYVCELLELDLDDSTCRRIERTAVSAGVPTATVVLVALETARVVDVLAEQLGSATHEIVVWLDAAAAVPIPRGIDPPGVRRLREYARALASGESKPEGTCPSPLTLHVPAALLGPWALRAAQEGVQVERWATEALAAASLDRMQWEIAAAYTGVSLEAWAALAVARAEVTGT